MKKFYFSDEWAALSDEEKVVAKLQGAEVSLLSKAFVEKMCEVPDDELSFDDFFYGSDYTLFNGNL